MIFTKEYIEQDTNSAGHFERGYINFLANEPELEWFRNKLDDIISYYPESRQQKIIDEIKSENDITCYSAISELLVYDVLINTYNKIEVEPELEIVNNKTPDFWVDNRIAFEVLTLFEKKNPFHYDIYEMLNRIDTEFIVMFSEIANPTNKPPKLSEIRAEFIRLFTKYKNIDYGDSVAIKFTTPQKIRIECRICRLKEEHSTVGMTINNYELVWDSHKDYIKTAIKRIRSKVAKYKNLSMHGYPLVVVIYDKSELIFDGNWNDVVSKVFNKEFNTSLSALLVKDYDTEYNYRLFENPFAKVALEENREIITSAFKTRVLKIEN